MKELTQKNRTLHHWFVIAAYLAAWCACAAPVRPPQYSVVPLGTPGTEDAWSEDFVFPQHINNKGDIIGYRGRGVVLYRSGTLYDLGYPREPLEFGWTSAINDRGEILGTAFARFVETFILPVSNPPLPLTEATISPVPQFSGWDFNDHGTIIGALYHWPEDRSTAVVYQEGHLSELPGLVPGGNNFAAVINNRDQILGEAEFHDGLERPYGAPGIRAVIWSGGRIQNLGVLPGFLDSIGTDINDHGDAVGNCVGSSTYAAFIYRRGVMSQLPAPPGARHTFARKINNEGNVLISVVPWRENDEATLPHDTWCLYSDAVLHDLTPIVARASGRPLQTLSLVDMNDRGQIIGTAQYDDGHGGTILQGILLDPRRSKD